MVDPFHCVGVLWLTHFTVWGVMVDPCHSVGIMADPFHCVGVLWLTHA